LWYAGKTEHCPRARHGEEGVIQFHEFLTSTLGRGERSNSRVGRSSIAGRTLGTHLVSPRTISGCYEAGQPLAVAGNQIASPS
jgi:hypothetical protein